MEIFKKISIRFGFGIALFLSCNWFYTHTQYPKDVAKYSRVKNKIDSAFLLGEIIYMGESSNTSFNPWTDTLVESISDYLQLYLPAKKVRAITHESYHPGLFRQMLNLLPNDGKKRTLIVTLNMRTCGPSAMFSGNEASNQQEALFYSKRLPLLTRIFLSLHYYDNRSGPEMERLKFQFWRTQKLHNKSPFITTKNWLDALDKSDRSDVWKHMADAYVKEFAFVLNDQNERVEDLDKITEICKQKNIRLVFHILPENRDYANLLFGNSLLAIMDSNVDYLEKRYSSKGATVINNYKISRGEQYTDQWYPTEHMNGELRKKIALSLAQTLQNPSNPLPTLKLKQNNWPNPEIRQPMADTMLRNYGVWLPPKTSK